jgi:hypothetical protein
MKYLIIATVVSLVLAFVYVRLRPYLRLAHKIIKSLNVVTDMSATTASPPAAPSQSKLVRCDHCGTWIPAERALKLNSGLATFCSPACMAKPASKERKIAG